MRKRILSVLALFGCFLLGALSVCYLVYKYPSESIIKTISEKNVTVTDTGIADAVEKIKEASVVVQNYQRGFLAGTGTGFVYKVEDDMAYIMTNHHVIENADTIKITYSDDSETTATLVGSDSYADIAVLKVEKSTILKVATLGSSENTRIGDTVFTIGNPMGIEYAGTVTKGILSNKDRLVSVSVGGYQNDWIMNVMQTDAAINPGNSGGPLCNANGEVIGINSMKIVQSTIEGIGFAIPIEDALSYAESLVKDGSIKRPYIGLSMLNASSTYQLAYSGIKLDSEIYEGVAIVDIASDSPASKAGLKKGDVIVKVGDDKVKDVAEFRYKLYSYNANETITLTINRDGKEQKVNVKLGSN